MCSAREAVGGSSSIRQPRFGAGPTRLSPQIYSRCPTPVRAPAPSAAAGGGDRSSVFSCCTLERSFPVRRECLERLWNGQLGSWNHPRARVHSHSGHLRATVAGSRFQYIVTHHNQPEDSHSTRDSPSPRNTGLSPQKRKPTELCSPNDVLFPPPLNALNTSACTLIDTAMLHPFVHLQAGLLAGLLVGLSLVGCWWGR